MYLHSCCNLFSFLHVHIQVMKSQFFVDGFVEKQLYSFLDYVSSGFELSFMVAVDFTGTQLDFPSQNSPLSYPMIDNAT